MKKAVPLVGCRFWTDINVIRAVMTAINYKVNRCKQLIYQRIWGIERRIGMDEESDRSESFGNRRHDRRQQIVNHKALNLLF